jgi:predicted dehydrogenase
MKAVMAGCGGITRAWFSGMEKIEGIEIVGLVDLDEKFALAKKEEQGLTNAVTGTDLAAVIKKSGADTVFDCTVPVAHHSVVTTALKNGCNVLGEKPLAETMEQAREMVTLARETGKTYAVIQNRRYLNAIRRFQTILNRQTIGKPHTFNADFYLGCHFGGFRDEMEHVLLLDMAIHSFDQARFLCPSDPVAVYCYEYNPPGSWYAHGASAMAIFEMADGSVFNYRGSWCAEGLNDSWQCDWKVVGDDGSATWDGEETIKTEVPLEGSVAFMREQVPADYPAKEILKHTGHGGVIDNFYQAVTMGTRPMTAGEDNIKSLAMVLAAIKSAEEGRRIVIEYKDGLPYLK